MVRSTSPSPTARVAPQNAHARQALAASNSMRAPQAWQRNSLARAVASPVCGAESFMPGLVTGNRRGCLSARPRDGHKTKEPPRRLPSRLLARSNLTSGAGCGLGSSEDARRPLLFLLLFALLAVGRDDDLLARWQLATVERRLDLFSVERFAFEQGERQAIQLVPVLFEDAHRQGVLR